MPAKYGLHGACRGCEHVTSLVYLRPMQQIIPTGAVLVKASSGVPSVNLMLGGGAPVGFTATSLFGSIGRERGRAAAAEG